MMISAVIPTYNRRMEVLRAVDSVLAQTTPVDEIIVVDDGSSDLTAETLAGKYGSAIKVIRQENRGVSAARNHAIRKARGEWIAFLDSDDVWLPTKIEQQTRALAAFGGEFGVNFTDNIFDGDPDIKLSRFQQAGFDGASSSGILDDPGKYIVAWRNPFVTSSMLVLRSLLLEIGLFDEALVLGEDLDLMFRLAFRTRFCFVAERLVRMDRTPGRSLGLEKLLATRDDRRYDSIERMFVKWLKMPGVAGTGYEESIRESLRQDYYSSIEAKIHELKIGPALRRISRLRALGDNYAFIAFMLLTRKIRKLTAGNRIRCLNAIN